jgi:hypothetical protein
MRQDAFIEHEAALGPREHPVDRLLALDPAANGVKNAAMLKIDIAERFARTEGDLPAAMIGAKALHHLGQVCGTLTVEAGLRQIFPLGKGVAVRGTHASIIRVATGK